jgi:glycerophosphoryl diester phosphodiesterase
MPRHPAQTPLDGARIPLLEDVLALVTTRARPGFRLYIELKTALLDLSQSADPGMLAETAVEMTRAWDLSEIVTFVSFDWRALARAKQLAPGITNAFTTLPLSLLDPEDASAAQDEPGSERERLRLAAAGGAPWWAGFDWRDQPGANFAERVLRAIAGGQADGWFAWHG